MPCLLLMDLPGRPAWAAGGRMVSSIYSPSKWSNFLLLGVKEATVLWWKLLDGALQLHPFPPDRWLDKASQNRDKTNHFLNQLLQHEEFWTQICRLT